MRGLHDDRRHAWLVGDAVEHRHAIDTWHNKVEEHEGNATVIRAFENLQGLVAGTASLGLEAKTFDRLFENTTLGRIVIDDQNTLGHGTLLYSTVTNASLGNKPLGDPGSDNR